MPNQDSKKSYEFFAPKVFIRTFGCQMNVRDSEVISGLLGKEGYKIIDELDKADIILFNTCSVRQHAEDKVWSEIGRFKRIKGQSPSGTVPLIGVIGCMAQNYKEKIFERAPNVNFAVGPQDLHKIPEIIKKLSAEDFFQRKIWETDGGIRPEEIYHTGFYQDKQHAYIVISEGCSNYCSYCVVPYVRGELRNRNDKEILKEIEEAVDKGITKITLLGQNVNAYQCNDISFVKLIELVNSLKGPEEFSFITSHPKDASLDLFKTMASLEKLKKYLHLPVQSGSDRILKLMNRGYARKFYLDLIDNYRKIVKGGILTTDIIVGFPTETADDFLDTYNLVNDIKFDAAYIFKYSPRPHTEAERLIDDVDKKEKERRHKIILDLQKDISNKKKCLKK
ncbi:MAG: tRNA (N6-isopentenyl adenosine(37)-C2)-methylthiotransferase MiaB [Candidatus Omnitrophota bacterium]|nr:tRNA (N6-isopentenyl adenosine(37)-C2)-methylthiotransferase MiaB [Candidatus Omnitrophota bacterium]